MCRLAGFWDRTSGRDYGLEFVVDAMRDTLTHGGPDDAGRFVDADAGLALGHRRLAILDLSPAGHQPMLGAAGDYVLVHNGEVYNFADVRSELVALGSTFSTGTDTEVILEAWRVWGRDCLARFRGMFAFALWERSSRRLTIVRDRAGVKPLYWAQVGGVFLFASEVRAFHEHPAFRPELDPEALSLYLRSGYVPAPYSIYKGVHKLRPGHLLELGEDGVPRESCYWDPRAIWSAGMANPLSGSESELTQETERILGEACELRLVSDVPVGVFLSGGVDSSLVTALLASRVSQPLRTFTIGFEDAYFDESPYAREVADRLGTQHTELTCTHREALDVVPRLSEVYDEPFGDRSAVPTCLVAAMARKHVTVALSADGGDEVFGGYTRYRLFDERLAKLRSPGAGLVSGIAGLLSDDTRAQVVAGLKDRVPAGAKAWNRLQTLAHRGDVGRQYEIAQNLMHADEMVRLGLPITPRAEEWATGLERSGDPVAHAMLADFCGYLPDDVLTKVDRATMAVALEGREPLLDHRVIEHAARLPMSMKYAGGTGKKVLKDILGRYLPADLVDRPKHGFGVPVADWMRGELRDLSMHYLSDARIKEAGVFEPLAFARVRDAWMIDGDTSVSTRVWQLLAFEMWRERWL